MTTAHLFLSSVVVALLAIIGWLFIGGWQLASVALIALIMTIDSLTVQVIWLSILNFCFNCYDNIDMFLQSCRHLYISYNYPIPEGKLSNDDVVGVLKPMRVNCPLPKPRTVTLPPHIANLSPEDRLAWALNYDEHKRYF